METMKTAERTENLLELRNIAKHYPGVKALDGVTLKVRAGEVHALLGENGAGKSTLIKVCSGAVIPNEGEIYFDGKTYEKMSPKLSMDLGIAVIYQEFNLVNALSVAENIFLGRAIRKGMFIQRKEMEERSAELFKMLEIDIDPTALVSSLSVGYQQMVEIAKALSQDVKLLIMDEPTAPLTNAETESLYKVVDRLKAMGIAIIYISHRLEDIFRLADRVTFLRDGTYIDTLNIEDCDEQKMIALMVGRELAQKFPPRPEKRLGNVFLKAEHISGKGVKDASFEIRRGEILGVGGLVGAGRTELTELIFGAREITSGSMTLEGKPFLPRHPWDAIEAGIGLVPEDRKQHGLILQQSIRKNIVLPILKRNAHMGFVDKKKDREIPEQYREELQIKTPTIEQLVKNLSGGNQQKVVIGKWLASNSQLIILDEPTRGIDVGAKYEIYKLMHKLVDEGKTILMVSSEMEELLGMSDRIIVMAEGHITGEVHPQEFSQERILTLASRRSGHQASEKQEVKP